MKGTPLGVIQKRESKNTENKLRFMAFAKGILTVSLINIEIKQNERIPQKGFRVAF